MIFPPRFSSACFVAVYFLFLVSTCFSKGKVLELYISPDGNDANPGTREAPKKTFKHVLDGVHKARELGVVDSEVTLWLLGGVYQLDQTLFLNESDSGEEGKPLIIRGVDGQKARLTTGSQLPVTKFRPATETALSKRLTQEAKVKVRAIEITDKAHQRQLTGLDGQLLWNGHLLEKCRWPNRGYGHVSRILNKGPWTRNGQTPPDYTRESPTGGSFRVMERLDLEKLQECHDYGDEIQVEGYFHNDWFFERIPLGLADNGKIQLRYHTRYGIVSENAVPRRFKLVNVVSELDEPGEWYFDPKTNLLAVWPVQPISPKDVFTIPGRDTVIHSSGASHIVFQNLVIEGISEVGMEIEGGADVTVGGCEFTSGPGRGLNIVGGKNHLVTGCQFRGLLQGLSVKGGERRTLEPCGHEVTNCEFSDLRKRGYGAVSLAGVGIRFANNLMHDMNGSLQYTGNDILIELNEFYNMGWEMGDWNAIYTGADWAAAGNVLRYNFLHHLMEMPGAFPVGAVRNDDSGQGTHYHGNVFFKSGSYCIAFNGGNNQITGNTALETPHFWYTLPGPQGEAQLTKKWDQIAKYDSGELPRGDKFDYVWKAEQVYGEEGWKSALWAEKYPNLKKVIEGRNGWSPVYSVVKDNYTDASRTNVHGGSIKDLPSSLDYENYRKTTERKTFKDARKLLFPLMSSLRIEGKEEKMPFNKIGLYLDKYRKSMPKKADYRAAVMNLYRKSPSSGGSYDPKDIKKRFPLPSYLRKES